MSSLSLGSPVEHPPQEYFSLTPNEFGGYIGQHHEHQDLPPVSPFNLATFAPPLADGALYPLGDGEGSPYVGPELSYPPEAYDYGLREPASDRNAEAEAPTDNMLFSQPHVDSYFYGF